MTESEFDVGSEVVLCLPGDSLDKVSGRITEVHMERLVPGAPLAVEGYDVRVGGGRVLTVDEEYLRPAPGPAIGMHLAEQESAGWHRDWPEALTAIRNVMHVHRMSVTPANSGADIGKYYCLECTRLAPDRAYVVYPCRTVEALAAGLGLKESK